LLPGRVGAEVADGVQALEKPITGMLELTCVKNGRGIFFSNGILLLIIRKKSTIQENHTHQQIEEGKEMLYPLVKYLYYAPLIQHEPLKLLKEKWGRKSAGKISIFLRVNSPPIS